MKSGAEKYALLMLCFAIGLLIPDRLEVLNWLDSIAVIDRDTASVRVSKFLPRRFAFLTRKRVP